MSNTNELKDIIEKLQFQVSLISETIDYNIYPLQALILTKNWDEKQLDQVFSIFEKWDEKLEQNQEMLRYEFENEFKSELNISYQGLKSIILAFYRDNRWTNVCKAYVTSLGNLKSIEYNEIV